jgi:hypothetical protein
MAKKKKIKKGAKSLVFEFLQFSDIEKLSSTERVKKIITTIKEDKIILIEGRFKKQEEAYLIQRTMESIDSKFKGIEIAVINPSRDNANFIEKIKAGLASFLLGEREGFTLIGPATIISEIRQDPKRLNQLSINLS